MGDAALSNRRARTDDFSDERNGTRESARVFGRLRASAQEAYIGYRATTHERRAKFDILHAKRNSFLPQPRPLNGSDRARSARSKGENETRRKPKHASRSAQRSAKLASTTSPGAGADAAPA
jgi:hypothetical protein